MSGSELSVLTVLVRYGDDPGPYRGAEAAMAAYFAARLPEIRREVLVVDNALPRDECHSAPGHLLLGGDNAAQEFSGWDRALQFVGRRLHEFDLVHFATSAFRRSHVGHLDRFAPSLLALAGERQFCLGHVDCYNTSIRVLGARSQHWIRTSFFFLPPRRVEQMGSLVTVRDREAWFCGDPRQPFLPAAPLDDSYRRYLHDWLIGGDIGQGTTWHSGLPLTRETLPRFEHKALAILNEHLLSVRLRAIGCPLVDVTWLATRLRGGARDVDWATPWHRQLAERAWDPVMVSAQA